MHSQDGSGPTVDVNREEYPDQPSPVNGRMLFRLLSFQHEIDEMRTASNTFHQTRKPSCFIRGMKACDLSFQQIKRVTTHLADNLDEATGMINFDMT